MCGITGALSSILTRPEIEIFEQLMIISTLRGREGAGIITVDADVDKKNNFNPVKSHKHLHSGLELLNLKGYKDKVYNRPKSALIGHCRFPTKGAANSIENVHPHVADDLCGVHNGTMWSVNSKYLTDNQSDSLALYKLIAAEGVQEAVNKSSGAYALVWVDNAAETINFLRNSDRPLYFATHDWQADRPTTLFWASEENFLELALARNNLKPKTWILPADEVHSFPYMPEGVLQPIITPCRKQYYSSYNSSGYGWVTDPATGKQTWKMREAGATRETFRSTLWRGRGRGMGELDAGDTTGEGTLRDQGQSSGGQEATSACGSNIIPLIQPSSEGRGHWAAQRDRLLSLPAPKYDHGKPIPDGGRETGTGSGGAGTVQASPGMAEELTMTKAIEEFNSRLSSSLEHLKKSYAPVRPQPIPTQNWRHLQRSKSERKAEKRQKALAREGKGPHNSGHKSFKETLPGYFVPPVELVAILHEIRCEWCDGEGKLSDYTTKRLKWLTKDRFLCGPCCTNPDAISHSQLMFPAAYETRNPLDKIQDDPVNDLFRRVPVCVEVADAQADCAMVGSQSRDAQEGLNSEATNDNVTRH